jgi:hypothetical protein
MSSAAGIVTPPSVGVRFRDLGALWRHAAWAAALFAMLATAVQIRLDVAQLHKDLDRNSLMSREEQVLHQRLLLEVAARTRAVELEAVATGMSMAPGAPLVRIAEAP